MRLMKTSAMRFAAAMLLATLPLTARAADLTVNSLVDLGGAVSSHGTSWLRGGYGKLDDAGNGAGSKAVAGQGLTDLRIELDPSFDALATLRLAPGQHVPFDVLESYARYRWTAGSGWQGSVKLGAFFPPISLENESVGWTSPWTLTPSAINSWVGDELRTIGGQTDVEWHYRSGVLGATGAVFAANDPAGVQLADRGWAFDSRPAGLFGEPRLPDALARQIGTLPPLREAPFKEIDGRPGWYAGAWWRQNGVGRLAVLYYDNMADPGAFSGSDFGWRTKFTSVGIETYVGDIVLLGQAMAGQTTIEPFADFYSTTNFQAGYLLAGYYFGEFRVAGRFDLFATQQHNRPGGSGSGEHGHALTLSGSWNPVRWVRLRSELLLVDSYRGSRVAAGAAAASSEQRLQLVARFLY